MEAGINPDFVWYGLGSLGLWRLLMGGFGGRAPLVYRIRYRGAALSPKGLLKGVTNGISEAQFCDLKH